MDTEKQLEVSRGLRNNTQADEEEEEDVPLPGFRFHPTDEELVGFYLHRKVEKKPLSIELIKQIDIYKYDPWDLPKGSNGGDKEWYFFCKRGRKYRNSIRPNRVTGSGFWKATGIDRPIYSTAGTVCIGLKKSLVYYRGCAGKGTKTDWMMHEFRLPPSSDNTNNIKHMDDKSLAQEAEVWTLCRILKRNASHKRTLPDWREVSAKRIPVVDSTSKTCSGDSEHDMQSYISFQGPMIQKRHHERKPFELNHQHEQRHHVMNGTNQLIIGQVTSMSTSPLAPSTTVSCSSFSNDILDVNELIKHGDWDDLRSVVEFAAATDPVYFM